MTDLSARTEVSRITQMTHGPWKGPSTIPNTGISTVTTEGRSQALDKSVDKLPPVMAGMDRAEALAFVVADRQHISDGCLQRDAAGHGWHGPR